MTANDFIVWALAVGTSLVFLTVACSSAGDTPGNDPDGFVCNYNPFDPSASYAFPSTEQHSEFEYFVLARVTGHRQSSPRADIFNIIEVEEIVFGSTTEGEVIVLQSQFPRCLVTGDRYYLAFDGQSSTGYSWLSNPWHQFPVINNRITLPPDMRKDDLIGRFHGLDPVLFKRRFVAYVSRTDIAVD